MPETGRETAGPLFLWQIFWPFWVDDAVAVCVAQLGPADMASCLLLSFLISFSVLYPFYRRREKRSRTVRETESYTGHTKKTECVVPGNARKKEDAGIRENVIWILKLFLSAASVSVFLNLSFRLPVIREFFFRDSGAAGTLFHMPLYMQIIVMGIASPLEEELLFRGMMFNRLRVILPFFPAAVVSAAFFGFVHRGMAQILFAGVLGFLLAVIYERFRKLWPVFVFHCGANLASVALEASGGISDSAGIYICLLVCSGAGIFLGLREFMKQNRRPCEEE